MVLKELKERLKKSCSLREDALLLNCYRGNKDIFDVIYETSKKPKTIKKLVIQLKKDEEKEELKKEIKKLSLNISIKKFIELKEKAVKILENFNDGYSMGSIKSLYVNNKCFLKIDETEDYATSCKYRATHGSIDVYLSFNDLKNIQKINGLWTILEKNNKCKWLAEEGSKQHYIVIIEEGYIYKDVHSTVSFIDAKHTFKKRELAILKSKKKEKEIFSEKNFIGVCHLEKIGACLPGIQNAARLLKIDLNSIGGIRIDYALELAKRNNCLDLVKKYLMLVE